MNSATQTLKACAWTDVVNDKSKWYLVQALVDQGIAMAEAAQFPDEGNSCGGCPTVCGTVHGSQVRTLTLTLTLRRPTVCVAVHGSQVRCSGVPTDFNTGCAEREGTHARAYCCRQRVRTFFVPLGWLAHNINPTLSMIIPPNPNVFLSRPPSRSHIFRIRST
jgi:hypothetical protein